MLKRPKVCKSLPSRDRQGAVPPKTSFSPRAPMTERRHFLKTASAALTTQIFTGAVKGANDRVSAAFIGMGRMGTSNLGYAMKQPNVEVAAVCDVYQPHLEKAVAATA